MSHVGRALTVQIIGFRASEIGRDKKRALMVLGGGCKGMPELPWWKPAVSMCASGIRTPLLTHDEKPSLVKLRL
jgi:hypothetical protein